MELGVKLNVGEHNENWKQKNVNAEITEFKTTFKTAPRGPFPGIRRSGRVRLLAISLYTNRHSMADAVNILLTASTFPGPFFWRTI